MGPGNLSGTKLFYQMQGTLHSHLGCVLIDTLRVSLACVGRLAQGTGASADVVAGKFCRLKHNLGGRIADLRI